MAMDLALRSVWHCWCFLTRRRRPCSSCCADSFFINHQLGLFFYFNLLVLWSGDSCARGAAQPQWDRSLLGLILSWFTAASHSKKKEKKRSKPPGSGRWPVLVILHPNGSWQSICGSLLVRVVRQRQQFSWAMKLSCSSLLHLSISHTKEQHRRGNYSFGKGSTLILVDIVYQHMIFALHACLCIFKKVFQRVNCGVGKRL